MAPTELATAVQAVLAELDQERSALPTPKGLSLEDEMAVILDWCDGDAAQAHDAAVVAWKGLLEHKPWEVTEDSVASMAECGFARIAGYSHARHPVLLLDADGFRPRNWSLAEVPRYVSAFCELCKRLAAAAEGPGAPGRFVMMADVRQWSVREMGNTAAVRVMVTMLAVVQELFPGRVASFWLVGAPWSFELVWGGVSRLLQPKFRKLVRFAQAHEVATLMGGSLEEQVLEVFSKPPRPAAKSGGLPAWPLDRAMELHLECYGTCQVSAETGPPLDLLSQL